MFERITFDPQVLGGRACIRGMRIPVSVIVGQLAHGASAAEVLVGYPDLDAEDCASPECNSWLTNAFRLTPSSVAERTRARWSVRGTRTLNWPLNVRFGAGSGIFLSRMVSSVTWSASRALRTASSGVWPPVMMPGKSGNRTA